MRLIPHATSSQQAARGFNNSATATLTSRARLTSGNWPSPGAAQGLQR